MRAGVWWLERRHSWRPVALLLLVATLLGLYYGLGYAATPCALGTGLGPWVRNWSYWVDHPGMAVPPGVVSGLYTVHTALAPGWQDWLGPLLISVTGAWFGARVRQDQAFLQLHPVSWPGVLALRLLIGAAALLMIAALASWLVTLMGQTPVSWLSAGEQARWWAAASALLWLRGLLVLALAAALVHLLPKLVAAGVPLLLSVVLIQPVGQAGLNVTFGVGVTPPEWFRLTLTPSYTPHAFRPLLNRDNVPLPEYQAFMVSHLPAHVQVTPGWGVVSVQLAVLLMLAGLTLWLGARRHA